MCSPINRSDSRERCEPTAQARSAKSKASSWQQISICFCAIRYSTSRPRDCGLPTARAELTGRVELHGSYAARGKGTFDKLDLARLVKGFDTRLNGTVELDARLRPTIVGRAEIALADSQLMGRALDGRATIALADQRIDVDINVASRSARLTARGGLGAGRELTFELIAPQLAEIVPRTSGSVTVSGTASGEFSAPQLRAEGTASDLKFANGQTIDSMVASIAGGAAATAPLAVSVKMTGHRAPNPDASLASATLIARGVTSDHTLELNGTTLSKQPVRLVANGGWRAGARRRTLHGAARWSPLKAASRSSCDCRNRRR